MTDVVPVPPTMTERVGHHSTAVVPLIARLRLPLVTTTRRRREPLGMGAFVIEAVASSAIEGIYATVPQTLLAYTHPRHPAVTPAGRAAAANVTAVIDAFTGAATYSDHGRAHDVLMRGQGTWEYAGGFREVNVSVGGHNAPAPSRVPDLMDDLIEFAHRTSPSTLDAAVAHAQFESIHPYPDGNGRIGRALLAGHLNTPVSVHLARHRHDYYDALRDYRLGDAGPIHELVQAARAHGTQLASDASTPDAWQLDELSEAARKLYARLHRTPVGTRKRMLGRSAERDAVAFEELLRADVIRVAAESTEWETVYAFLPVISPWASLADTAGYGTRSMRSHWAARSC